MKIVRVNLCVDGCVCDNYGKESNSKVFKYCTIKIIYS